MSQYLKSNPKKLKDKIDHIVVLMLENRSFDQMLGWLYSEEKPPPGQEFEGLTDDLWNPLDNIDADGVSFVERVPVERNGQLKKKYGREISNPENFCLPDPDPGEGFKDTNHQLFQRYNVPLLYPPPPTNLGFVQNYQNAMIYGAYSFGDNPTNPRDIMKCYTPEQTPVLSGLARGFAVCDHYHCSIPSQTLPNRDFIHAATSTGYVNNAPQAQCHAKTIFGKIQDAIDGGRKDLSWGIFGNNMMPASGKKREEDLPGEFDQDHFSLTRLIMTELHDARFNDNFGTLEQFASRCQSGDLPSYSFLEPTYGGDGQNDQHPPTDIRTGEKLIADIYNEIKGSPAFERTLFIVTYDEHGGCYDHVAPPEAVNPDPENNPGQDGFLFNRFGVRVPCVVVNPLIPEGMIARPYGEVPFDHTSVIKTICTCFGLDGHLTERDKAAPDFSCLLALEEPRENFPEVSPLDWNTRIDPSDVNDLHRVIAAVLEKETGEKCPKEGDFIEFIQKNYNALFGSGGNKTNKDN